MSRMQVSKTYTVRVFSMIYNGHPYGHPCHGQLTAVKKEYPLTSVTLLCRRLKCTTH